MFFSFVVTTATGLWVRVPHLQSTGFSDLSLLRPVQGGPAATTLGLQGMWETSWEKRDQLGLGGGWFPDLEWGSGTSISCETSPTLLHA